MHKSASAVRDALLVTLGQLAEQMASATNAAAVLKELLKGARGLVPFTAGALAMKYEDGWRVWRATAARPDEIEVNDEIPPEAAETLDRFMKHGQPVRANDLLTSPWRESSHRDVLWKDGTRSALLLPLVAGEVTLGALSFTSTQPDSYPEDKHHIVAFLAWMVATTLRALPESEEKP